MAIVRVQQAGSFADEAANIDQAFGSDVTSGNLLIITVAKLNLTGSSDAFLLADLSKTAGAATIGTITLDVSRNYNYSGTNYIATATYSVPVTGSGSLTMRCVLGSSQYGIIGVAERSGLDITGSRVEDFASAEGATANGGTPSDSGNADSAAGALFVGALVDASTGGQVHTEDGAFAVIYEQDSTDHCTGSFIDRIVTTGTTDAANWSSPANDNPWAASVAVYKEASAGGATARPNLLLLGVG